MEPQLWDVPPRLEVSAWEKRADVILLKYPSYKFLPYHVGMNLVDTVIKDGELYMM